MGFVAADPYHKKDLQTKNPQGKVLPYGGYSGLLALATGWKLYVQWLGIECILRFTAFFCVFRQNLSPGLLAELSTVYDLSTQVIPGLVQLAIRRISP